MANQRLGEKAWNESPKALVVLSIQHALLLVCVNIVYILCLALWVYFAKKSGATHT